MSNTQIMSGKKTMKQFYSITKDALRTVKYMRSASKKGLLDNGFKSRIMLAVTEVNGCEMCRVFHAGEALKSGMSNDEIQEFLTGDLSNSDSEEGIAIFFAQHYAEEKGKPDLEAWDRVVHEYGREKALGILGATRVIMFGNTSGIGLGALHSRLKLKPVKGSSFIYEIKILFGTIIFLPLALLHNAISIEHDILIRG